MIDTHAHLDACADPPEAVLARARAAGVARVVTVGTTIDGCRAALALAEREDGVFAALGIHPHGAGSAEAGRFDELEELLGHERAVAVGETGLDFFRDYAPHDAQSELFAAHRALAVRTGLPLVIHTRAADDATMAALADHRGDVILHCFSSAELTNIAVSRGYYISFAGNVTYPGAADLREATAAVPAERLLAETDCPYLAPQGLRGRPNEPANVMRTLDVLAEVRGVSPADLAAQIDRNATAVFRLP